MKNKIFLIIISLFVYNLNLFSQEYKFIRSTGSFTDASAFLLTNANEFIICDAEGSEIIKTDYEGNIINSVKGFASGDKGVDYPADIDQNLLRFIITDKYSENIFILDKDLNYLSTLPSEGTNGTKLFNYPLSCKISDKGDYFILSSNENKIIKMNYTGTNYSEIVNRSKFARFLENPQKIITRGKDDLFLLNSNKIIHFDQFGSLIKEYPEVDKLLNMSLSGEIILANSENRIYIIEERSQKELVFLPDVKIVQTLVRDEFLYVLTRNEIRVFKKINFNE